MSRIQIKSQLHLSKHSNPEECNECSLKKKYMNESNVKCVRHQFQQKEKEISNVQITFYDEIVANLQQINIIMPDFIDYLAYTQPDQSVCQIQQILKIIDKIKDSLTNKLGQTKNQTSIINYSLSQNASIPKNSQLKQIQRLTSDKSQSIYFQIQQQDTTHQYIKQWVEFYTGQLVLPLSKKKVQNKAVLPLQQLNEMRSFKQKTNIKIQQFLRKVQDKQKTLNQAINKLAFYIDKVEKLSPGQSYISHNDSRFANKYLSLYTPIRGISTEKSRSNKQSSRQRLNSKGKNNNSFKANTSSFALENVSQICQNTPQQQEIDSLFMLLAIQAQSLETIINKRTIFNENVNINENSNKLNQQDFNFKENIQANLLKNEITCFQI